MAVADGPRRGAAAPSRSPPSDREAGPEHPADQIRFGAEMVEARDVARFERGALLVVQVVAGEIVVAQRILHDVLAGDRGQDLVEGIRRPAHGCTQTVAQPVIHSATGSYARTSPFQPGTAPSSATQLRISWPPLPPSRSISAWVRRTSGSMAAPPTASSTPRSDSGLTRPGSGRSPPAPIPPLGTNA